MQLFTIHPVGQGLFYSGLVQMKIDAKEEFFRFVYDCGSLTKGAGEDEVDRFRKQHFSDETDRLGLLVISHFDADHIKHIKLLLATKRKVDKIVMPFMEFAERLFLVLRYLENRNGTTDDAGIIRFILNPIGELGPHLDDDGNTTVFLVTPDPDNPAGGESNQSSGTELVPDDLALEFWFKQQDEAVTPSEAQSFFLTELNAGENYKIRTVKDSITADLHFKGFPPTQLMEFVFYRRGAVGEELKFYKAIFDAFCQKYKIDKDAPNVIDSIVDAVRTITGSKPVKDLYKAAKKLYPNVKISDQDIVDLNTTALCMLHRNMEAASKIFGTEIVAGEYDFGFRAHHSQKIPGLPVQIHDFHSGHWYGPRYWNYRFYSDESVVSIWNWNKIPNVLLTSDAFLKTQGEVDAFLYKYRHYLDKFWLVQVPHHGSKKSSDQLLYSRIPYYVAKFINYGTKHSFEKRYLHPDKEVGAALVAGGHGHDVFAVTEHSGCIFSFYRERN